MNYYIVLIVQGQHAEHTIESPRMTKEIAQEQLAKIRAAASSPNDVDLEWTFIRVGSVISATIATVGNSNFF